MDVYNLSEFVSELKKAKEFLLKVEAYSSQISISGLKGLQKWPEYTDASSALSKIEPQLAQTIRFARFINPELHERLQGLYQESPIVSRAIEIGISVQISNSVRTSHSLLGKISRAFDVLVMFFGVARFKMLISDDGQIPIRRMLVDISRLIPLIEELETSAYRKIYSDREAYKPSNINVETVKVFIDKALIAIGSSDELAGAKKSQLTEYLEEIRAELSTEEPSWKKLVGALVIVSAILGGLAVALDAYNNVRSALEYILGTSIEDIVPNMGGGPMFLPDTPEV
jgi:hypothetical protein